MAACPEESVVVCVGGEVPSCTRGRVNFPEVHGGPEGVYEKDRATGRWRSVSRGGTVRHRSSQDDAGDFYVAGTRKSFDEVSLQKESCDTDGADDAEHSMELAKLREAAAAARNETQQLWEALSEVVTDDALLAQMRRRGQLGRLHAEVEFETQRRERVWQLLKDNLDIANFTAVTRKATGCEGEKALSIGAGVRLFEKSADFTQGDASGYTSALGGSAAARTATPAKMRRNASRPSLNSTRASSSSRARDLSSSRTAPKGKHEMSVDQLRDQIVRGMKDTQVGKDVAPSAQKGGITRSDSVVRMRVRDLEPKAAHGGA